MNHNHPSVQDVKGLDLVAYLKSLGYAPAKVWNNDYWYLSPLRPEKEASFKVNRRLNAWYDHSLGRGGNLVDFGLLYHGCSIKELLQKMQPFFSLHPPNASRLLPENSTEAHIKVTRTGPLLHPALYRYLRERKIDLAVAKRHTEEVLEESKGLKNVVEELKQQVWQLGEKQADLEKKLDVIRPVAPPVDTAPVQGIVRVGFDRIQQLVAELPRPVVHEKRFLLFPEHHATEYYRIIFRVILWLTLAITVTYLFALGKQALENAKEVKLRELELTYAQRVVRPRGDPQGEGAGKQGLGKTGSEARNKGTSRAEASEKIK